MKPLTAKEVEAYLKRYGYRLDRVRGKEPLKQGILNGIFNDVGIPKPLR